MNDVTLKRQWSVRSRRLIRRSPYPPRCRTCPSRGYSIPDSCLAELVIGAGHVGQGTRWLGPGMTR